MKFSVSTKPLLNGLNLGIVDANVSKFYQKSTLAQVTANKTNLTINLEASSVLSEIRLKGSGDSDETCTVFVDCLILKKLVSTFEAAVTIFEFTDAGLVLHSGKSKFNLPKIIDEEDFELTAPSKEAAVSDSIDIDKTAWKFVKDFQMYAIAMSFIHPVYTRVYVGENGDVIVGDFDNGLFTYSKKNNLGKTCLLTDTIINLFNSLPEGASIAPLNDSYVVNVKTDSFEFTSEFTPDYENDDDIGRYNADLILNMMKVDSANSLKLDITPIKTALDQSALLSSNSEDRITFEVSSNQIHLVDNNINCQVAVSSGQSKDYSVQFKTESLKSVISKASSTDIEISPVCSEEDRVDGVFIVSEGLTTVLAGVE